MPRRSIPQPVLDDAAFPIRVKLRVPDLGLGKVLVEMLRWLRTEVGEGNFAYHDTETLEGEALALYFRKIPDAAALLSAFPKLETADTTTSRTYSSQALLRKRAG